MGVVFLMKMGCHMIQAKKDIPFFLTWASLQHSIYYSSKKFTLFTMSCMKSPPPDYKIKASFKESIFVASFKVANVFHQTLLIKKNHDNVCKTFFGQWVVISL